MGRVEGTKWSDKLDFFHQNRIDLQKEIPHHPTLVERLQAHPVDEYEIRLAEVGLYCEVYLDGEYTPAELDHLCGILYKKLVTMRSGIITDVSADFGKFH